jgi:hypothetical protein
MLSRYCPSNTILNVETAPLYVDGARIALRPRCIPCHAEKRFIQNIRDFALAKKEDQEHCAVESCFQQPWSITKFCQQHLNDWTPFHAPEAPEHLKQMTDTINETFRYQWTAKADMKKVLRLRRSILAGQVDHSKLQFLDLEYNPRTGRIFEIALCDVFGEPTLNCLTQLSGAEIQRTAKPQGFTDRKVIEMHEKIVRKGACDDGTMSAAEVADNLKRQGVDRNTTFVVWGKTKKDLTSLREWLEAEGFASILAPDTKCVMPYYDFRNNLSRVQLSDGRPMPLKLSAIFAAFFGTGHHLYGRNHRALPDTLQLWHVCEAFAQLQLPPLERDDWEARLRNSGGEKRQISLEEAWSASNSKDHQAT